MHEPPTEFQKNLLQAVTHYHHFDICCIIIRVCHAARALLLIPKADHCLTKRCGGRPDMNMWWSPRYAASGLMFTCQGATHTTGDKKQQSNDENEQLLEVQPHSTVSALHLLVKCSRRGDYQVRQQ
jgi:hypothetical protein